MADSPLISGAAARLSISYDGTGFHGWQLQPEVRTVQGELIRALAKLVPLDGIPPGAGRTDTGVHARGQVCSVPVADESQVARIADALPGMVPGDIAILEISSEPPDFHARFSARGRRYSYRILPERDPFRRHDHLIHGGELDVARMQEACKPLVGDHDCTSFCRTASLEPGRTTSVIRSASLELERDALVFRIAADRFLHSMVRTIVGTLLEIGRGRRSSDAFVGILEARDRRAAGATAPPHGLCLDGVEYDVPFGPNLLAHRQRTSPCDESGDR